VTVGSGAVLLVRPGLEHYPPTPVRLLGIPFVAADVDRRIDQRFDTWMAEAWSTRCGAWRNAPGTVAHRPTGAWVRELLAHVEDGVDLDEAVEAAKRRTRPSHGGSGRGSGATAHHVDGPQDDRAGIVAGALEMLDGRP